MAKRSRNTIKTNLVCTCCGNIFNIHRKFGDKRERGHIKHLWCFKCKDTTAHKDYINDYDISGEFAFSFEEGTLYSKENSKCS